MVRSHGGAEASGISSRPSFGLTLFRPFRDLADRIIMSELAETTSYPIDKLVEFSARVFQHFGVSEADAVQAADVLATSDLRGIDSHGVARLHSYFDMLTLGRINPRPRISIVRELPSVATVDGDNGLGLVVGAEANEIAEEKRPLRPSGLDGLKAFRNRKPFRHRGILSPEDAGTRPDRLGHDQLHEAGRAALGRRWMLGRPQPDRNSVPGQRRAGHRH